MASLISLPARILQRVGRLFTGGRPVRATVRAALGITGPVGDDLDLGPDPMTVEFEPSIPKVRPSKPAPALDGELISQALDASSAVGLDGEDPLYADIHANPAPRMPTHIQVTAHRPDGSDQLHVICEPALFDRPLSAAAGASCPDADARALLGLAGVAALEADGTLLVFTKTAVAEWDALAPLVERQVLQLLSDRFSVG